MFTLVPRPSTQVFNANLGAIILEYSNLASICPSINFHVYRYCIFFKTCINNMQVNTGGKLPGTRLIYNMIHMHVYMFEPTRGHM